MWEVVKMRLYLVADLRCVGHLTEECGVTLVAAENKDKLHGYLCSVVIYLCLCD